MLRLALSALLAIPLLACSGPGAARADRLPLEADAQAVRFGPAGQPALEYRRGSDGLKPYVKSLVTPSGIEVLRDEPPGHEHHHGLMLAYGVDDVDFWGERYAEVPGRQCADSEEWGWRGGEWAFGEGPLDWPDGLGFLSEDVRWIDPRDGSIRLEERRAIVLLPGHPLALTWFSALSVPEGREEVTLWGRPYFGLGLRFAEPFERIGRFTSSEGAEGVVVRGDERLTPARWCACTAEVDGRTVTVALFDHPSNPRHPARFFTMAEPFAYLSATLDLAERPLELVRGETLVLVWGLTAWEEPVTADEIERAYEEWTETWDWPLRAPPQDETTEQGD